MQHLTEDEATKEHIQGEIRGYTSLLHQKIGQEEFVLGLSGLNKILNPDKKVNKEMEKGGLY